MFETFLLELAKILEFKTLKPDQQGTCLIVMKESQVHMLFEPDEQIVPHKILVSSPVAEFPVERRAEIYEMCLKSNNSIEETVSVKPDEDIIYLHRRIAPEIEAKELEIIVHGFIKQVQKISADVEKILQKPAKRPTVPPSSSSIEIFPYKA